MNIPHVKTVEWDGIMVAAMGFRIPSLAILFCFSELSDDRDPEQLLTCQLYGKRYGLFISELDIADSVAALGFLLIINRPKTYPLDLPLTRSLTI